MRYFNTTGIVLKKNPRGENDLHLVILTPDMGKINALCKHARHGNSNRNGHLETLSMCALQIYRLNQTILITEAKTIRGFIEIKDNLNKSLFAQIMAEIITKATPEEESSPELFALCEYYLNTLASRDNPALILEEFKIKLLRLQGMLPGTDRCHDTGEKWQSDDKILLNENGHLSSTAQNDYPFQHSPNGRIVPFRIIKLINHIAHGNSLQANFVISNSDLFELQQVTGIFLKNFLQAEVNSEQILHSF